MAWYRTGTIAVINGSANVTGTGTAFVSNALAGQGIVLPDGRIYEVATIVSNTVLTLAVPYLGASASGQPFVIVPTRGPELALAQQIAQMVADYGAAFLSAGQGLFANGTAALPGIRFSADTDTGIRRSGTNALAVVTGGTDQLTVTTTGAVLAGLLTGTAVAQADDDVTAGRLLRVGSFGWGAAAPNVAVANALDALLTNQRVRISTPSVATVNGPIGASGGICDTYAFGATNAYQEYREITGLFRMWRRGWFGGSWSPWVRVPNLIVGAITASGGEATAGGIIERGSNANGDFTRFADGTQICTHVLTGSASATVTWTYPASFSAVPSFVAAPRINSLPRIAVGVPANTTAQFRVFSETGAGSVVDASLMAVGRWF